MNTLSYSKILFVLVLSFVFFLTERTVNAAMQAVPQGGTAQVTDICTLERNCEQLLQQHAILCRYANANTITSNDLARFAPTQLENILKYQENLTNMFTEIIAYCDFVAQLRIEKTSSDIEISNLTHIGNAGYKLIFLNKWWCLKTGQLLIDTGNAQAAIDLIKNILFTQLSSHIKIAGLFQIEFNAYLDSTSAYLIFELLKEISKKPNSVFFAPIKDITFKEGIMAFKFLVLDPPKNKAFFF